MTIDLMEVLALPDEFMYKPYSQTDCLITRFSDIATSEKACLFELNRGLSKVTLFTPIDEDTFPCLG